MVTIAEFRAAFPAFLDPGCYPNTEVAFWMDLAVKMHNAPRWGELLDQGIQLFVAHHLAIEFNNKRGAKTGQAPGQVVGTVTSGSVDKVSYSRDASAAMDPANGHWNLTSYGLLWVRLSRMVGAGPIQVGTPYDSLGPNTSTSAAWPGVLPNLFG